MYGGRFLTLILAVFTFAACSPMGRSNIRTAESQPEPAVKTSVNAEVPEAVTPASPAMDGEEWLPDWQVVCKADYCPPQVGILIRPRPPENGLVRFKRCTASLVSNKWILTAGHCDSDITGYFITQKIGGKKYQRKLKSPAVYKKYVAGKMDPQTGKEVEVSGEMDIAIYEMEEEIPEEVIKPFSIASGKGRDLEKLYAYVSNPTGNPNEFKIEERICEPHRHEGMFPYSLTENPDVITAFKCDTVEGNSGGPFLADPRSMEVEAVLIGGVSLEETVSDIQKNEKREAYIYEKHSSVQVSSARCAEIPGRAEKPACIRANIDEQSRRFAQYQEKFFAEMNVRSVPNSSRYGFQFTPYKFQVKTQPVNRQYEIFYQPKCRLSPQAPKTVDFPVENMMMKYDEWAQITLESIDVKVGTGKVKEAFANGVFGVDTDWPAPIGEFVGETPGLREQLGPSFNVALPICGG